MRDEIADMEDAVDLTIQTIKTISEDTIIYINSCLPGNLESYRDSTIESTKTFNAFIHDLKEKKLENLEVVDDLQQKIKLAQDELSKLDEEVTSVKNGIAHLEKKHRAYTKENLQLKQKKKILDEQKTKIEVLQALTDTTILSDMKKNIYGFVGSEELGKQKPFKVPKTDLPKCTYQLAKEVFDDM